MKIVIKYFGMIEEAIKKSEETLSLNSEKNIYLNDIHNELKENYPVLKKMNYKIAVNLQITEENTIIENNTEIVLLPPFAGG